MVPPLPCLPAPLSGRALRYPRPPPLPCLIRMTGFTWQLPASGVSPEPPALARPPQSMKYKIWCGKNWLIIFVNPFQAVYLQEAGQRPARPLEAPHTYLLWNLLRMWHLLRHWLGLCQGHLSLTRHWQMLQSGDIHHQQGFCCKNCLCNITCWHHKCHTGNHHISTGKCRYERERIMERILLQLEKFSIHF